MRVLVDTSVWSLAFRRKSSDLSDSDKSVVRELSELIQESRVVMIGPIRQEILSGISSNKHFEKLRNKLRAFIDFPLNPVDYERASEFFNICRKKGVQVSHIDFLICAVAFNNELSIFTVDKDFKRFSQSLDIELHKVRKFNS